MGESMPFHHTPQNHRIFPIRASHVVTNHTRRTTAHRDPVNDRFAQRAALAHGASEVRVAHHHPALVESLSASDVLIFMLAFVGEVRNGRRAVFAHCSLSGFPSTSSVHKRIPSYTARRRGVT